MATSFVPGKILAEQFFRQCVEPLIERHWPSLTYSAALIGLGSEVLGFDTEMSMDHDWGPRVLLFLQETQDAAPLREMLTRELPPSFQGHSTLIGGAHRVKVYTIRGYFQDYLGVDVGSVSFTVADWLIMPQQTMRTITDGVIFRDDIGLEQVRQRFVDYYPRDIWLYLLACSWLRLRNEEHLMSRAGFVGDDLGSAIMGGRLVRDLMQLCFLMERRFAPYPKWFGSAFRQLSCGPVLYPMLQAVQASITWQERADRFCAACEHVAVLHNATGITPPLPTARMQFWDRPFPVLRCERFAQALLQQITDPAVLRLVDRDVIGNIDQISDSTVLHESSQWRARLHSFFDE
jgi:hypothetical protein